MPSDEPDNPAALRRLALSHLQNRSDFLDAIDAHIGGLSHDGPKVAVLIVDAATPNQSEDMVRALGQAAADWFEDQSARSIGAYLPADTKLYALSPVRFGCILQADTPKHLEEILDGLAYGIRRPGPAGHSVPAAGSIGIGIACHPQHGADAAALLRAALSAAHESLNSGAPWRPYDEAFDHASRRAAQLLRDIVPALAGKDQLRLVYQPKVDLTTGRCIGGEALLRWNHPALGPIPPDEFVPLMERTTLVNAMTDWTLAAALPQVALWRAGGLDPQISINVSMQDLGDDHFAARLAGLLERHAVQPEWIDIEVTESALLKDPARVGRQLDAIRRLGVAIEIDDYGTGQSGLSYLKHIPARYLKIDQSFVAALAGDTTDQIIVRSTIDLAHGLGLRVVAEGIRDEATLDWLRAHGCDIGQSNLFSPPLEARDFEQLLRTQQQQVTSRHA
jgi:EAL domain-containing protein (putative c-di-GMP-specific phosphodiesterase class I)/GGDEF domain-containing protein